MKIEKENEKRKGKPKYKKKLTIITNSLKL